jgi:hypothetical protein
MMRDDSRERQCDPPPHGWEASEIEETHRMHMT